MINSGMKNFSEKTTKQLIIASLSLFTVHYLLFAGEAGAASSVRAVGPSAGVPVAAPAKAAKPSTRASSTGAVRIGAAKPVSPTAIRPIGAASGANARLSSTQFLTAKGQSLGGGGVSQKDLSDYATNAQLDSAELRLDARIDALDLAKAEASNVYTISEIDNIIAGIELLEGAEGPQGPQGPVGPVGPTGAMGATGLSAYQIAVSEGFIGTEVEWLTSISFPTASTDGLYLVSVDGGVTTLQEISIADGTYQEK